MPKGEDNPRPPGAEQTPPGADSVDEFGLKEEDYEEEVGVFDEEWKIVKETPEEDDAAATPTEPDAPAEQAPLDVVQKPSTPPPPLPTTTSMPAATSRTPTPPPTPVTEPGVSLQEAGAPPSGQPREIRDTGDAVEIKGIGRFDSKNGVVEFPDGSSVDMKIPDGPSVVFSLMGRDFIKVFYLNIRKFVPDNNVVDNLFKDLFIHLEPFKVELSSYTRGEIELEPTIDGIKKGLNQMKAEVAHAVLQARTEPAEPTEPTEPAGTPAFEPPPEPPPTPSLERRGEPRADIGEFAARIGASDRFRSHGEDTSQWWEYEYQIPGYDSLWYPVNATLGGGIKASIRLTATIGGRELENIFDIRIDQCTSADGIDSGITAHIGETQDRLYIYEALGARADLADALTIDDAGGKVWARFYYGRSFEIIPAPPDGFDVRYRGDTILSSVPADISRRELEEAILRVWKDDLGTKPELSKAKERVYYRTEDALPAVGHLVFFKTPSGPEIGRIQECEESSCRVVTATGVELLVSMAQIHEDFPFAQTNEDEMIERFVKREKGLGDVWDMDEDQFVAVYGKIVEKHKGGKIKSQWRIVDPYSGEEIRTSALALFPTEKQKQEMLRDLFEQRTAARDKSRQMKETLETRGFSKPLLDRMERLPTGSRSFLAYKGPGGKSFEIFEYQSGQIRLAVLEIGLPIRPNDGPDMIDRYIAIIAASPHREEFPPDASQYAASSPITKTPGGAMGGEADLGIYIDPEGGVFVGSFQNGLGRLTDADGHPMDPSEYRYADGRSYYGYMRGGERGGGYFGGGIFTDAAGNACRASFDDIGPVLAGSAEITYASGDAYRGAVVPVRSERGVLQTFERHGSGTYTRKNPVTGEAIVFEGIFDHDVLASGRAALRGGAVIYAGDFADWEATGSGAMEYEDGSLYQGNFSRWKREGVGIHRGADGSVYVGEWLANKVHGQGTFRSHDGKKQWSGRWENGKPVEKGDTAYALSIGIFDAMKNRFLLFDGSFVELNIPGVDLPCRMETERDTKGFHDFKFFYGADYELIGSYVKHADQTDAEVRLIRIGGALVHIETGIAGAGGFKQALEHFQQLVAKDVQEKRAGRDGRPLSRAQKPWGAGDRPADVGDVKDEKFSDWTYTGEWDTATKKMHGAGALSHEFGDRARTVVAVFANGGVLDQRGRVQYRKDGEETFEEYDGDLRAGGIENGKGDVYRVDVKTGERRLLFRGQFAAG
ncbi:MAG: hypothetical protein AAB932_01270 [Patescibacteria group bacterium]